MKKRFILIVIMLICISISVFADSQTAQKHKKQGDTYFLQKNYKAAIEEYKVAINFDPNLGSYLNSKIALCYSSSGISHFKNDSWSAAEADFKRSIKYNPDQSLVYYNLGVTQEKLKNYNAARESYKKYLSRPDTEQGLVAFIEGRLKKLDELTKKNDHYQKGLDLMDQNNLAAAKSEFLLVEGEHKPEAEELIKSIDKILSNTQPDVQPPSVGTGSEKDRVKTTLLTLAMSFEKKDIKVIRTLYSKQASNSLGNYGDIMSYYNDYWFTLFSNLKYSMTELTILVEGTSAVTECRVEISGDYSGPDLSNLNSKFTSGHTELISGTRQFLLEKENNFWYIVN